MVDMPPELPTARPHDNKPDVLLSDAQAILKTIRLYLHVWPFLVGALALVPSYMATETSILIRRGLPPWLIGVALLVGGVLLLASQIIETPYKNWALAVGDFIIGTECLSVAILMGNAALHYHASWMSVGLWLLPALLFEMLCVQRIRGG